MISLASEQLQVLQAHAAQSYPQECCGLLIGTLADRETPSPLKVLRQVWPTENAWGPELKEFVPEGLGHRTRHDGYWIAPETLLQAQKYVRRHHLEIIGIYHSHPDHAAVPSEMDRTLAWPQYTYLIFSVQQGRVENWRAWVLDQAHNFQPEAIVTHECAKIDPNDSIVANPDLPLPDRR